MRTITADIAKHAVKRADYAGNTALHLAAVGPDPLVLRELLTRGASVHVRNRANNTPLYLAEKMGNGECVRLLKEAGAHLWLDNELKGEGSRVPSRGGSPARGSPPGFAAAGPGDGVVVTGEAAAAAAEEGNAGRGVVCGGEGVVGVGEGLVEAGSAREEALLTGGKGRVVG